MQFKINDYNELVHDIFPALSVKQPYASKIVVEYDSVDGVVYGEKSIEVRTRNTSHRGDLLICSSKKPIIEGYESGCTLGLVELYDTKKVSDFTEKDWLNTCIPIDKRNNYKDGYGWFLRNPRRVIEFPVTGQLGIWNLVFSKDLIIEYPKNIVLDEKAYNEIVERLKTIRNGIKK